MSNDFEHLLSPITFGKTTFKNRMGVAPMGDGYLGLAGPHGEYSEVGIEHVMGRARGGFGFMFMGCTMMPDNKVDPCDPGYAFLNYKDYFMKQGLLLNEQASIYDMKLIQQLTLGVGRNHGCYSCSPTGVFGSPETPSPVLTKDQIKQKIDCVVEAAELVKNSGFTGIEIHALHWGYLLDQFEMAITNKREDEYGGSLENRMRVCKEIIEGVKQVCGTDYPVSMRLGLKSYIKGLEKPDFTGENEAGRTLAEGIKIATMLQDYGYDMLSVDVGTYDSFYYAAPPEYMPEGHVISLAAECKKAVDIPVFCGSRMNDPFMDEEAVASGKVDGVVMGRQSLADPDYVKKLAMGKPEKIRPCIGCLVGCMGNLQSGKPVKCAVNPTLRKEIYYTAKKALIPKKVAIVGGGIAGMEVARTASMRGHDVTIYERTNTLGGLLIPAGSHDFKKDVRKLNEWYKRELDELKVKVVYNVEIDAEKLKLINPDTVVLAIGSKPIMPPIEGIDSKKCVSGVDALLDDSAIGNAVVVVGGGLVGCETAIDFAMQGKDVTIVEAAPKVLAASARIPLMVQQMIPDLLENYNVRIKANYMIKAINDHGAVVVPSAGGEPEQIEADNVVMSIGMKPLQDDIADKLMSSGIEVYKIGDFNKVGNIYTAINGAYEIAANI